MNKKDVKNILISMRTNENGEIVNKLLGKIDIMDDISIQTEIKKIEERGETVENFLKKAIENRMKTNKFTPINEMFSYGLSYNSIHLHLPVDLHQTILEKGFSRTIDLVNLYLIDAIDKIKSLKDNGYYKFQQKEEIYLISPALIRKELQFLNQLDFSTKMYERKELQDNELIKNKPEAMRAIQIFGKERNVGVG